jgi:hypothetical protein
MTIKYDDPVPKGDGWWFRRTTDDIYEVWFGPYPDELNSHYNLQRLRRADIIDSRPAGLQQNLFDSPSWRQVVRDVFGPTSIEGFPPRGSRG